MSGLLLSEQLVMAGIDVEVFATTANGKDELPVTPNQPVKVDGVTVTYFKRLTKDHTHYSPALIEALKARAREFDLVHIHAWWNLPSVISCSVALKRNVPVLLSPRGTLSDYSFGNRNSFVKSLIHNLLGKKLLKKCHFHVTSQNEYEAIANLVRPKSVYLVENFIQLPPRRSLSLHKPSVILRLLFLSRIEAKKGLDILINALKFITIPYRLTVAGDGDKVYIETLKTLAAENGVSNNIDWVGFYGEEKFELINEHDLFILPSHNENFGNVVIESLSVGTPVLISNKVGLADYVSKKNLGWICETETESVADSINAIANNKKDLERIRQEAPAIIYEDFEPANLVEKYTGMYNKI